MGRIKHKTSNVLVGSIILSLFIIVFTLYIVPIETKAIGECSSYGFLSYYDILTDSCKCSSGYVWGEDIFGDPQCVSGDSLCHDKYGYGSSYDSFSNSCECDYGYVFGKDIFGQTQCITESQACKNQLGLHSRATYGGKCECSYGYVIDGGQCVYGNTYCSSRHGIFSSYDSLSNSCECDDGYTLDDHGQCVEKENNVYFRLLDINEDTEEIIVQSEYDFQNYILEYGLGCSFWIDSYLGQQIVLGLGTDFSVDYGDRIVLQNHDTTCQIFSVEWTNENEFEEEEEVFYYVPTTFSDPVDTYSPNHQNTASSIEPEEEEGSVVQTASPFFSEPISNSKSEAIQDHSENVKESSESMEKEDDKKPSIVRRIIRFFRNLF